MLDYTIIVPCYNEQDYLWDTLCAIRQAIDELGINACRGECVVVDNMSTDDSRKVINYFTRYYTDKFRFIESDGKTIASVRNHGAYAARGRFLIYVDADTLISPSVLREIVLTLSYEEASMGSVAMKFNEKDTPWADRQLWKLFKNNLLKDFYGACMFCRADLWTCVNGFDESLKIGEDWDFAERCKKYVDEHKWFPYVRFIDTDHVVTSGRLFNKLSFTDRVKLFGLAATKNITKANQDTSITDHWYRNR